MSHSLNDSFIAFSYPLKASYAGKCSQIPVLKKMCHEE